jgi:adenylylsulfate kinase
VKGLYKKAIAGEIANFTGVSDPYEEPEGPDILVNSDVEIVAESAAKIMRHLKERGLLAPARFQAYEVEQAFATGGD